MNFLTKSVLTAAVLMSSTISMQSLNVTADTTQDKTEHHVKQQASDLDLDVSQGWKVVNYESDTIPDVNDVFLQGVDTPGNQKCVLVQAGNIGDAGFTAQKVIPMKKGHKYNIDLIYAQFYDQEGTGYIDFNGDRKDATNDTSDQEYIDSITPEEDMDYTITVSFKTQYPGNAYLKLGYDKSGNGIDDIPVNFDAPVVNPDPEAGTSTVSGTAIAGNTVTVTDTQGNILGNTQVSNDGTFNVQTNRALHYKEKIIVTQSDESQTSPSVIVEVVDTKSPDAPTLNKITDEDKQLSGTSEPYSTVYVTFEGSSGPSTYEGTTQSDGTFTITLDQNFHGKTAFTAYANDEAGNKSKETSGTVEFAQPLSVSLNHHITSIDTTVTGTTSRPKCQVSIHFGTRVYSGTSDENGKFNIPIIKYNPGTTFTVEALDLYDEENPTTIDDTVLPRIPALETRTSGVNVLKGVADPNATVSIILTRGDATFTFTATADEQGNFSIPMKDDDQKDLILSIGDILTYSATLPDVGLTSESGSFTIYTK